MEEPKKTENDEQKVTPGEAGLEADGYYGEDEMDDDELDLSFLDEEEADGEAEAEAQGDKKPGEKPGEKPEASK